MVLQEISSEYKRKIKGFRRDNIVFGTIKDGSNKIMAMVSDVWKASQEGTWYDDQTIYHFCQRLLSGEIDIVPETLSCKIFNLLFFAYFGNTDMRTPNIDMS